MARWHWSMLLLGAMVLLGCSAEETPETKNRASDPDATTSTSKDDKSDAAKSDSGEKKSAIETPANLAKLKPQSSTPKRDTFAGRWVFGGLQVLQGDGKNTPPQYGEMTEMIIGIQLNDADPAANSISVVAARDGIAKRSLKLTSIKDQKIEFECIDSDTKKKVFDYSGQLFAGHIIGTLLTTSGDIVPIRLIPTEERTFARVASFRPFEEQQAFIGLMQSALPEEDIKDLAKDHPTSPMLKVALMGVAEQLMSRNTSAEDFDKFVETMLKSHEPWGAPAKALLLMDVTSRLILTQMENDYISKWVDRSAAACDEASLKAEGTQKRIANLKDVVKLRRCIQGLESKKPEDRTAGRELAAEVLKKSPFHAVVQWKLADANREDKLIDDALSQYAELAVFPLQEAFLKGAWARERSPIQNTPPTERVAQLWKEKNGKSDGLDEYLAKVYDDNLLKFVGEPVTKREKEDSNRVVLIELFTGSRCEQCVSADVAIAGIQKTYPTSMVVVLRYHQHNPAQDPLATEDGEARLYNFYRGQGTPTVALNGHDVQQTGGLLIRVNEVYPGIKQAVETELAKSSTIKIDLSAKRTGDDIKVTATATGEGLEEGSKRLRIALTESGINYAAPNGIRRHDMVVRQLLAGEGGIEVDNGKLGYEGQINVAAAKTAQAEYLDRFAKNQRVEFNIKPLEFKNLSVVAWVQDEVTREVFQTIVVPVE